MRLISALALLCASATAALAENAEFTLLATVPTDELNRILDEERAEFIRGQQPGAGYVLPEASKATNAVEVYTVRYESKIPELGDKLGDKRIVATGLVALPVVAGKNSFPVMAYQHGTVYVKHAVPSFAFRKDAPGKHAHYDDAYETRYMTALYAGNGHVLMAADYFGMGGTADMPEAYFVKASAQQANIDLYRDLLVFLERKRITPERLFLGGWSQGGLNTTGFLERLEQEGVAVAAAFTASAPNDPFASLNGFMYHPQPGVDAPWLNTIVALSAFSFEHYYSEPDLARKVVHPRHYDALRTIYDRSYASNADLVSLLMKLGETPLIEFFRDEYRDPAYFANSAYGRRLAAAETYRQQLKTPLAMYCGTADEAIREPIGRLASTYQGVLIGETAPSPGQSAKGPVRNPIRVELVPGATHRLTFISAAPAASRWMREMASAAK